MAYIVVGGQLRQTYGKVILDIAERGIERLRPHIPAEERPHLGGVIYVAFRDMPNVPVVNDAVGTINGMDKLKRYSDLAPEKPLRTLRHVGHVSSCQSQDDAQGHYPGGIVGKIRIGGFSGLPGLADKALMLECFVEIGELTLAEADEIAAMQDNPYWRALRAAS